MLKRLFAIAVTGIIGCALTTGSATAAPISPPAPAGATKTISCPAEQWYAEDIKCTMAYNGSNWYSGDWVALHRNQNGTSWVNGYSKKTVHFRVSIVNGNGNSAYSPWIWGGTGGGTSAGSIRTVPALYGYLEIKDHPTVRVPG
ncbi:hypothetical protein [Streptomyces sp. NPDC096068]|uniref:hypothetical protein n=1 Tax=Streptomyces sp. NPDC096068 TaxID=3155424 RepID=UPI003331B2B7